MSSSRAPRKNVVFISVVTDRSASSPIRVITANHMARSAAASTTVPATTRPGRSNRRSNGKRNEHSPGESASNVNPKSRTNSARSRSVATWARETREDTRGAPFGAGFAAAHSALGEGSGHDQTSGAGAPFGRLSISPWQVLRYVCITENASYYRGGGGFSVPSTMPYFRLQETACTDHQRAPTVGNLSPAA